MKKLLTCLPILLLVACEKDKHHTDPCIDENAINPDAMCYTLYDPVCGCDGVTYSNDCVAKSNGVKMFTPGACHCTYPYKGVVLPPSDIEECHTRIQLSGGRVIEVMHLPEGASLQPGQGVKLNYRPITTHTSPCGDEVVMADVFCIAQDTTCTPVAHPVFNFAPMQDKVQINSVRLLGDCLTINFSYSGGCEQHHFELRNVVLFCGTPSLPPTTLKFVHDANDDNCKAWLTEEMSFDISSVRQPGVSSMPVVIIDYHGTFNTSLTYTY